MSGQPSPKPDVAIDQIVEYVRKVYGIDARNVALATGGDAEGAED
jgi:hypothetical protein